MFDSQRWIAIAGISMLIAACGGGSGSTGLIGDHVKVTITNAGDASPGRAATHADAESEEAPAVAPRILRVSAGFSGLAHHLQIFEGASYTAKLQDCNGDQDTTCTLHAATAGTAFGPPTPITVGNVSVCFVIDYVSDLSGTLDVATGDLSEKAQVSLRVYFGDSLDQPCPACVPPDGDPQLGEAGICAGGPDDGRPCTVEGLADPSFLNVRGTSLACRPHGDPIGRFTTVVAATTGDFVLATSEASPNCGAASDRKCLCALCDDPEGTPCHSNADCPSRAGVAGVCGASTQRFPTLPNECDDLVCTATPTGGETGVCENGPIDGLCAVQTFRSCATDSDCPAPGDTCKATPRSCFLDRIALIGTPDPFEDRVAHPTLVGGFCLGAFGAPAVNAAGGFPGPVSYVWPARIVVE